MRDLRNRGGEVLDRVERGERLIVTRDGRAVAELRSLPRRGARPEEASGEAAALQNQRLTVLRNHRVDRRPGHLHLQRPG